MISKWFEFKGKALALRHNGNSIRDIEKELGIPRSTLSGWFKNIKLTDKQHQVLKKRLARNLILAREQAVVWHNKQKANRLLEAEKIATSILTKINVNDKNILELALSMLYLGEGAKNKSTSMGNSNPKVVKFFIKCLLVLYNIKSEKLKCDLHLRSDQSKRKMIKYWSNELNLPVQSFIAIKDKRLIKSKTYESYKGVCVIRCGRVDILRRLGFLNSMFCDKILSSRDAWLSGRASF